MGASALAQELAPLEAQIEQARRKYAALENELRVVEAELDTFSAERQRFDALRDVCNALDTLGELQADQLFWEGTAEAKDPTRHVERVRSRITRFEERISGVLEKQQSLQGQIAQCLTELEILYEEEREAHEREEERKDEFAIKREISPVPFRAMVMPWTKEAESERDFRRALLVVLFLCLIFGVSIPLITVPIPDRLSPVEIPERLAQLVKQEAPKPPPEPTPEPKQDKEELKKEEKEPEPRPEEAKPEKPPQVAAVDEALAARKKAESLGVLKFKNAFADIMKETPVANLGTEAQLSNSQQVRGQAVAQRSLVAMQQQGGSSGGIANAGVSRNAGNSNAGRLGGGVGFTRVESSIAGLEEASRPLQDGVAQGRTDEEIQIVFDRYKAALYRIYNTELRKDPTLQGKILLRITIEPDGALSLCKVESTDLASPELVGKIVERIKRINFGAKEGVETVTILYPIDFFPAG